MNREELACLSSEEGARMIILDKFKHNIIHHADQADSFMRQIVRGAPHMDIGFMMSMVNTLIEFYTDSGRESKEI